MSFTAILASTQRIFVARKMPGAITTHWLGADQALAFTQLDDATRQSVITNYHNAGIALMVSAFGATDAPTGSDPVATANNMAAFVKQYGLDGIDVDYEDFTAMNSGTGSAENWLISFTNQLRTQLPVGREFH